MTHGIVYIAMGEEYDKMAAHCLSYSRRYTNIPMTVITNLPEKERHIKWKSVKNIDFLELEVSVDINRSVKTRLNEYTTYDKTLYLDCDTIIQGYGVERIFDRIDDYTIVLNLYGRWDVGRSIPNVYKKTFENSNVSLPINIYYGALVGFCKSRETDNFFDVWNQCWVAGGSGRDMPALSCSAKLSDIEIVELTNTDSFFTWIPRKTFTIQHEYGRHVRNLVGCPDFRQYKPFDRKIKS